MMYRAAWHTAAGKDFAIGVCRHFALLFATGACAPPPSSAQVDGTEHTKARVSSLKELDQHLFLDALVDVSIPLNNSLQT